MHASMTITIEGIDAFTTAQEFKDIFDNFVVPAQKSWRINLAQIKFRQKNGRFPNGEEYEKLKKNLRRRVKAPFTNASIYLPLWKRMYERRCSFRKALRDLKLLGDSFDRRNAQRGIRRLNQLLRPV